MSVRLAAREVSSCSPQSRDWIRLMKSRRVKLVKSGGAICIRAFSRLLPGVREISMNPPSTKQTPRIMSGYLTA